jgi:hypothetical protein
MSENKIITTCPWSLVAIHWIDAFDSENGWVHVKEYKPEKVSVVTVGFLWPDCLEGYVSVTGSWCPDEGKDLKTVGMVTHIPHGMVQEVVVINQAETKKPVAKVVKHK